MYFIVINNEQAGPYSMDELKKLVKDGTLTKQTYVWKDGMENWQFASQVDEVNKLFMPTPPPIPMPGMPPAVPATPQPATEKCPDCGGDLEMDDNGEKYCSSCGWSTSMSDEDAMSVDVLEQFKSMCIEFIENGEDMPDGGAELQMAVMDFFSEHELTKDDLSKVRDQIRVEHPEYFKGRLNPKAYMFDTVLNPVCYGFDE